MTTINTLKIKLNDNERSILQRAYDIIDSISYHVDEIIVSNQTGEIIQFSELCRVKGILSGLVDNIDWEEEIKAENY